MFLEIVEVPIRNSGNKVILDYPDYQRWLTLEGLFKARLYESNNRVFVNYYDKVNSKHKNGIVTRSFTRFLFGDPPSGLYWDHIDVNYLNNRSSNLRVATLGQNLANTRKQQRKTPTTSKYKGVSRVSRAGERKKPWAAMIRVNGKLKHLGVFETEEEAHEAYCRAGREIHGDFFRVGESLESYHKVES